MLIWVKGQSADIQHIILHQYNKPRVTSLEVATGHALNGFGISLSSSLLLPPLLLMISLLSEHGPVCFVAGPLDFVVGLFNSIPIF